jgi:rhodanese-related sulfurtransferase
LGISYRFVADTSFLKIAMIKDMKFLKVFSTMIFALMLFSCSAPKSDIFIVDVRTPQEFSEGSLKGAVNIPLSEIGGKLNEFKDKKEIFVFCRSGGRSSAATELLKENGITNVKDGGGIENARKILNQ